MPASAKVKLNLKSKALIVGKTATVKISGAKKTVKWSVSNSHIRITKKTKTYAKVKALSKGTSYLNAKVGNKIYKCKFSVKDIKETDEEQKPTPTPIPYETPKPDPTKEPDSGDDIVPVPTKEPIEEINASEKIVSDYQEYEKGIVGFYTNNNEFPVSLEVKIVYYNSSGDILDYSTDWNNCLGAGKRTAFNFSFPTDENYDYVPYSSYKAFLEVEKSSWDDDSSNIKYNANVGASSIMCEVSNMGTKDLYSICLACVYYDKNNKVIGYDYSYPDCEKAGTSNIISFYLPYDENYDTIIPSSYQIFEKGIYS